MTVRTDVDDPLSTNWRGLLNPAAALWLAIAYAAVRLGRWQHHPATAHDWGIAAIAIIVGWTTAGLLGVIAAELLGAVWLAPSWGRFGRWLLRRRSERWNVLSTAVATAAKTAASGPAETAAYYAAVRDRNRIGLAAPGRPGRMADRIAALETRIDGEYGLDVGSAWWRLWLLLPESARADVREARAAWSAAVSWAAWSLLIALLGIVWWPAAPIGAALFVWSRHRARAAIATLAHVIEAVFDVYAIDLARRTLPGWAGDEVDPPAGQRMTALFRKGT